MDVTHPSITSWALKTRVILSSHPLRLESLLNKASDQFKHNRVYCSGKPTLSVLELFSLVLYQLQRRLMLLLDLELSVRLADDPSIVQLPARSKIIEKGQKAPSASRLARPVVDEGVYAGVLHRVRYP